MLTRLRMPDEIYDHELDQICLPQRALAMMHAALADPHVCFYDQILIFLNCNYNADASQMDYAFQLLQQDLARGRVLISRRLMDFPAFRWIPSEGDDKGRWQLSTHALPEHHSILQLTLDHAKTLLPFPGVAGATEAPSALGRAVDKVVGAAKQVVNDLARQNAAQHAQWQAETGTATFTDNATGAILSPDEVKQRWEDEGKDVLPLDGPDQQAGAQAAQDSPAIGTAMDVAMMLGTKGRNIARHPDDAIDSIGDLVKDRKGSDIDRRRDNNRDKPDAHKAPKMQQYEPPCFQPGADARKNYRGSDKDFEKDYYKQLKMQEDGINNMKVSEYLENRRILQELTDQHGSEKAREILTKGGKAQREERESLKEKIRRSVVESMKKRGIDAIEAEKLAEVQVKKQMDQLAALHNPDLIAGGKDEIGRMGNKGVNASIGAQWPRQGRVTGMDDAAQAALEQFGPEVKMNVKLERCR